MIDAREIHKNLKLPLEDEAETRRLGADVVAILKSPKFDGRPINIEIPAGDTPEQNDRSYRIACALLRRFQMEYWTVHLDTVPDAFGGARAHRLWFTFDAPAMRDAARGPAKSANGAGGGVSLRRLHDELSLVFGSSAGAVDADQALPEAPVLSVIFGTYNRLAHLQRAVASIRRAAGDLTREIVVCDGGSTDGSRAWLAAQPDVLLVGERRLEGAVRAFNQCFALARGEFIANLNDDCEVKPPALADGVAYLRAHPDCGQVAFAFAGRGQPLRGINDVYPKKDYPRVTWGTTYANFGVTRRTVAEKVARIQGGFWNPTYRTYAGDCELSAWIWKLGHTVDKLPHLYVEDVWAEDELRERNVGGSSAEARRMYARWPAEAFLPDGPEPRVSSEELGRFRAVRAGTPIVAVAVPRAAPEPPDTLTVMAGLCGLPEPAEERRLSALAPRVRALDPVDGCFPKRAAKLTEERVLHVSLCTDADPQAGLVRALRKLGSGGYREVRWFADFEYDRDERQRRILDEAAKVRPTVVFMQLQVPDAVDLETVRALQRMSSPPPVIATWCGDIATENAPWAPDWQVPLGRLVDLTLHSSMTHVRALRGAGIHTAGYLQIGYDEEQYRPVDPDFEREADARGVPRYDVAFLGSRYGQGDDFCKSYRWRRGADAHDAALRDDAVERLRAVLGARFGLFGTGWGGSVKGVALARSHEVYWRARMGLNASLDNKLECYSSDRLHRIAGCGALVLTKRFPMMSTWGLEHGVNCLAWDTAEEAVAMVQGVVSARENEERLPIALEGMTGRLVDIAAAGAKLARENWTWDVRVHELQCYVDAVRAARGGA